MPKVNTEQKIVVSACLLGKKCRFDGGSCDSPEFIAALAGKAIVPVCPEELGGLTTPRPRARLIGGDGLAVIDGTARVVNEASADVTEAYLAGGRRVARAAFCAGEAWSP